MRKIVLLACCLATPASATGLRVTVEGEANGVIEIDLFEDVAPGHVERITTLAREGFYDGVAFHRVMEGFMAQTGDGQCAVEGGSCMPGTGGSSYADLKAEFSDIPFKRGVIGMARTPDPNSANSQFFIMFAPGEFLNGQYTVVGEVTSGMEVVDQIKLGKGHNGAVLGEPDRIVSVEVTD